MKKRIHNAIGTLRGNNGSGMVLVLVCMMCVSILGVMILYLSYTGYMMKITQRQSKADFYSATTAIDEIRAGIQKEASDCAGDAYKVALVNYSRKGYLKDGETLESKFQSEFKTRLMEKLKQSVIDKEKYNLPMLQGFLKSGSAIVTSADNIIEEETDKIVLKNICVTYTGKKDYTTSVTTDISIGMPDFVYVFSNGGGLDSFATIANQVLAAAEGNSVITGNAYAGSVSLNNVGTLAVQQGTFICKNDINVSNGFKLSFDNKTTLWANRIVIGNDSTISATGNTNVKDDLDLAGYQAQATIEGSYYGFGNSPEKSEESSAIIANGRKTKLDMTNLNELVLAGHSFISNNFNGNGNDETMMGESLSVRGNQLIYMVPVSELAGVDSNPYIFSGTQPSVTLKNQNADYDLKPLYMTIPGSTQKAVYYFMGFKNAEKANAFFKDYFNNHTNEIQNYMSQYMDLSTSATSSTSAAGYVLKGNAGSYFLEGEGAKAPSSINTGNQSEYFRQLSTTLFVSDGNAGANTTPYTYYVDTIKVSNGATTKVFKNSQDKIAGIVVKGDYDLNGESSSTLRVVIASGNVTVTGNYTGLIIAGGNITLKTGATVKADSAGVTAALSAVCGNEKLSSYFLHGVPVSEDGEAAKKNGSSWNLDKLVTYENWSKS